VLRALSAVGIIWDLRPVPATIYEEASQLKTQVKKEA